MTNAAVPPGVYGLVLTETPFDGDKVGGRRAQGHQRVPQFFAEHGWGYDRIRLEFHGKPPFGRGGFYLHNSRKGYSHGCIEVGGTFLSTGDGSKTMSQPPAGMQDPAQASYAQMGDLEKHIADLRAQGKDGNVILLIVKYKSPKMTTNGGTGTDEGAWSAKRSEVQRNFYKENNLHGGHIENDDGSETDLPGKN